VTIYQKIHRKKWATKQKLEPINEEFNTTKINSGFEYFFQQFTVPYFLKYFYILRYSSLYTNFFN